MKTKNQNTKYKVAVVCDPLYKYGGAEKHLQYILETFPGCTLYTAFYDKEFVEKNFSGITIKSSFMQFLPGKLKYPVYNLLQPLAYGGFSFKGFDVVVSLSIAFAKFVRPSVPHVNICMSPSKYFWDKEGRTLKSADQLKGFNRMWFKFYSLFVGSFLEDIWKNWDRNAAQRADRMIAISKVVQKRIKEYYLRDSDVMYPPVEVKEIEAKTKAHRKENWFLYLGRIETYKGVELAIRAAWEAKVPIKIAGTGEDLDSMKELVRQLNAKGFVKFLGFVSEDEKLVLLSKAKALVFPVRKEDFGIVPVEANAAGTPVIAYREGGVVETICDTNPKTGVFFTKYDYKTLAKILKKFDGRSFKSDNCRKQAESFAVEIFKYKLKTYVEDVLQSS